MNYTRYFTKTSLARMPSPIRVLTAIQQSSPPSMISMAGGAPNAETFPITEATLTLKNGETLKLDAKAMVTALQYSPTPGIPDLVKWLEDLQKQLHGDNPLWNSSQNPLQCLVTNGSQDGICKTVEAMLSPQDSILLETPVYPGTLAAVKPLGCRILEVPSDSHGINPDKLLELLSQWKPSDAKDPLSNIPKVLYCIPNGGNPTGSGLTLERKKKIYQIAQQFDLIIMEDDPYYYIQFSEPRVPSFLSMDVDGRVIRFDSMSKLLSSGMRLGFVTAVKPITDRIQYHIMCSSMHASGLSQVALLHVLKNWGPEGFLKHAEKTRDFYKNKCDQCLQAAEKHLQGVAEWSKPSGGMFLWIKTIVPDTHELITKKAREKDVLFVPGNVFSVDSSQPSPYLRASYSYATYDEMCEAFSRLRSLLLEEKSKPS